MLLGLTGSCRYIVHNKICWNTFFVSSSDIITFDLLSNRFSLSNVYCSSDSVFAAAHCLSCCLLCWMFRLLLLTETMIYGYTIDCGSELDVHFLITVKLS